MAASFTYFQASHHSQTPCATCLRLRFTVELRLQMLSSLIGLWRIRWPYCQQLSAAELPEQIANQWAQPIGKCPHNAANDGRTTFRSFSADRYLGSA